MKNSLYLFGAVLILATTVSCSKEEPVKKNYYGVTPENQGVPKEAYYTFAGAILFLAVLLAWLWKKIKKS